MSAEATADWCEDLGGVGHAFNADPSCEICTDSQASALPHSPYCQCGMPGCSDFGRQS